MHWSVLLFGIFIAVNGSPRLLEDHQQELSANPAETLPRHENREKEEEGWPNNQPALQNEIDRALNEYDNKQLSELVDSIAKDLNRCDGGSCEDDHHEQDDQKDTCNGNDCRKELRCGCGGGYARCGGRGELRCGCGGGYARSGGPGELRCGGRGDLRCACGGRGALRCGCKGCGGWRCGGREDLRSGGRGDLRCGGYSGGCKKKKRPSCGCGRSGDNQVGLEDLDSLRCGGYSGGCKKKKRPSCGCGRSGDNQEGLEDLDSLRCGGREDLRASCKKCKCCCKKKKKKCCCKKNDDYVFNDSTGSFEDLTVLSGLRCGESSGCGYKKKKKIQSCGCGRSGDRDSYEDSEESVESVESLESVESVKSEDLTRNSFKLYDSVITDPDDVAVVLGALFERCKSAKCVVNELGEDDLEVEISDLNKYDQNGKVSVRVQNLLGYLARIGDSLDSKASRDSKDYKKPKSLFPKTVYQAKRLKQKLWNNNNDVKS